MENREVINWLIRIRDRLMTTNSKQYEALTIAIAALEKQEKDRWIPVTDRLPETTDPVNVTWVNNDPVSYYEDIKGKRFTATAHYHRGKWWWYSSVCQDLLDEYGKSCMDDEVYEGIEILAWRPLPEPYKEEEDEQSQR